MKSEIEIQSDLSQNENNSLNGWFRNYYLPLEIEIGFGDSPVICKLAEYQYNKKFIGIEKLKHFCLRAERYIKRHSIRNVKIINNEAYEYISKNFPSNRADTIHIYFPSPGSSAQRLFTQDFVNQIYRILRIEGQLRLLTDDTKYFTAIYSLFNNSLWQHTNWCRFNLALPNGCLVGTYCEKKYGSKYAMQVVKK